MGLDEEVVELLDNCGEQYVGRRLVAGRSMSVRRLVVGGHPPRGCGAFISGEALPM